MNLDINYFTALIPIIFAIITAFIYLFGRVVGDTQPQKNDKCLYYLQGVIFISVFIVLPHLMIPRLEDIIPKVHWSIDFLSLVLYSVQILQLVALVIILNKINPPLTASKIKYFLILLLIVISSIVTAGANYFYWNAVYNVYTSTNELNLTDSFFSLCLLILAFFIYIMLATLFGYNSAKYPVVKIICRDKRSFEGKVVNCGDYVTLVAEDMTYKIKEDDIYVIEESKDKHNKASSEKNNDPKDQCKSMKHNNGI